MTPSQSTCKSQTHGSAETKPLAGSTLRQDAGVDLVVDLLDLGRPGALDVSQNAGDLVIGQHVAKSDHVRPVGAADDGLGALAHDPHEKRVVMMPGVPCLVMGWRGKKPGGIAILPVRFAFKIGAMTACTMGVVKGRPFRHPLCKLS